VTSVFSVVQIFSCREIARTRWARRVVKIDSQCQRAARERTIIAVTR
jgi:hypothetical protein